jgi:Ca-activated chloride channel homolog
MRQLPLSLSAALLLMTALIATAQVGTDASVVYVHVTATNSRGQYVTRMLKEHFKILEDNKQQDIVFFSSDDDRISAGILVDARGDMKDRIKAVATSALTAGRNPQDQIFLAEPGENPFNDAVYQGVNKVLQLRNDRRALVLFTDRSNPGSYSFSKVKDVLRDQDVQLYAITFSQQGETPTDRNVDVLRDLAQLSGGNSFSPNSIASVENIYKNIASALRNQYVIGYRPTNQAKDGKWRKIKITAEFVDEKKKVHKLTVRAKPGYYAPTVAGSSAAKN